MLTLLGTNVVTNLYIAKIWEDGDRVAIYADRSANPTTFDVSLVIKFAIVPADEQS